MHQCEKSISRPDNHQEMFGSIEKSSLIVSDLFFKGLKQGKDVVLSSRGSCFIRLFENKENFSASTLNLGYVDYENNPHISQADKTMIHDSRLRFVSRNKEHFRTLSLDSTLPYESPIKIEIELSSKSRFILSGLLDEFALASIKMASKDFMCRV